MQKISIRLEDADTANLDSFAVTHGMSRAASTEFFVKLGMREFMQHEAKNELLTEVENLKISTAKAFETLYRATAYLSLNGTHDPARFALATESANKARKEIFGHD